MNRQCKCGVYVTKDNGYLHIDGTAQCAECAMTWHIVAVSGIDPWTARMRARARLEAR